MKKSSMQLNNTNEDAHASQSTGIDPDADSEEEPLIDP